MARFKPYLATDWDSAKQKYPVGVMPKIDGVRGMKPFGELFGRRLISFANKQVAKVFGSPFYDGMYGELAVGDEMVFDLFR